MKAVSYQRSARSDVRGALIADGCRMILPLGDSPNPRGVPLVTYALVLANVAVYVLISLPLSNLAVDPSDPTLHEYVRIVTRSLPQDVSPQEILANTSAYDLFVFRYGFRPAARGPRPRRCPRDT